MIKNYYLSGSVIKTNNLLDNPCLSRSLIADYSSSTCYKRTSTVENLWLVWQTSGGLDMNTALGLDYCPSIETHLIYCPNGILNQVYNCAKDKDSRYVRFCNIKKKTYTCPSTHPTKLNNSTCEFREPF